MGLKKQIRRWICAVMAVLCCAMLMPSVTGTSYAVCPQEGYLEPIGQVCVAPKRDYAPLPMGDDLSEYARTLEEAAEQLRRQFKDWNDEPDVYVQLASLDGYQEVIREIVNIAMAHTGDPKEGDYLFHQFEVWGVEEISYRYIRGMYYLEIEYEIEFFTTRNQEQELDREVRKLLNDLNLDDATDYQKVKGVYDWLCQNVTYDYANLDNDDYMLKHSAYAALVDRTSVCQGYALAMYRLLLSLGVDVRYIGGIGNGGPHGWNIVKLGGKYYNVDATWDATYSQAGYPYQFFLKNDAEFLYHQRDGEVYSFVNTEDYPMADASYDERSYTVIFRDEDGMELSREVYHYGDAIVAPAAPVKAADHTYTYTFSGWDAEVGICTGDQTFTAVYEKEYIDYLVVFQYEDGTLISQNTYHYGDEVHAPEQVSPPAGQEDLMHDGWDTPVTTCDGNKVYTAVFAPAAVKGDFDGDDAVTNSDVIYLLWYTLFPDSYSVSQNADFTGDGQVTNQDVIHLLWHTLFPDSYPLT